MSASIQPPDGRAPHAIAGRCDTKVPVLIEGRAAGGGNSAAGDAGGVSDEKFNKNCLLPASDGPNKLLFFIFQKTASVRRIRAAR